MIPRRVLRTPPMAAKIERRAHLIGGVMGLVRLILWPAYVFLPIYVLGWLIGNRGLAEFGLTVLVPLGMILVSLPFVLPLALPLAGMALRTGWAGAVPALVAGFGFGALAALLLGLALAGAMTSPVIPMAVGVLGAMAGGVFWLGATGAAPVQLRADPPPDNRT